MIRFSLRCGQGHEFEEWFSNNADFDTRQADAGIACPDCGDTHVVKGIMAPNVAKTAAAAPAPSCGMGGCGGGSPGGCPFANSF